ncbi:MAG: RagB/SusD family nutrient uptake outer membrane protein [Bacteroidales bacterium]
MKKILLYTFIASAGLATSSCNDFLDCEPITSVSTGVYLYNEADLAAYAAKFYNDSENENDNEYGNILPSHGSGTYNLGLFAIDNGSDNQTANTPNKLFVKGQYYVGEENLWKKYFRKIRATNYFLETVIERYNSGKLKGNDDRIRHYIGEVYFFRAYIYFTALQNLGDFPILTQVLSEDYESVREASKRRPRNEVARFILSDLDKAYEYMLPVSPVSNRLNKDCAALVKSRVALFEGTWEKYHKGTAFVPGGSGWPGASADYLNDFKINADAEIEYFLQQSIEAADLVAGTRSLHDDYAALFNSVDLSGINEILLWRKYSLNSEASSHHFVVSYLQRNGGGNAAFTRSMVDSYLMKNGLPIYADNSLYQGDATYDAVFDNRDPRMDQTILKTGDLLSDGPNLIEYIKAGDGYGYFYRAPIFEGQAENSNVTGYSMRKGLNTSGTMQVTRESYTGCPVFRAAEAYLNYMEAYYELNGNLGGNCNKYWTQLRTRAGMDTDYQKTIAQTSMALEQKDWGSYSRGAQVDATLYNIRRERRIELAAEGFRFADLKRWRALDQVQNVHIQGCNFWDNTYKLYTDPQPEDAASALSKITLIEYGTAEGTPNVSAKSDAYADGKYLLPYRKNTANIGFNGLNWNTAKYLYPISNQEFRLTTLSPGSNDYDSSTIYQNPGWSKNDGTLPEGE